jgi:hypothetical protein
MTRDYVEQVIHSHFEVKNIAHTSLQKGWNYDGKKYTAVPQGIKEKPIYVLQKFNTYTQNDRIIYEITMNYCNYGEYIPTEDDTAKIRASIVSGDLSSLTVLQTEYFKYYLDKTTSGVVFLAHTLVK